MEVDSLAVGAELQLSFRLPGSAAMIDAWGVVVWGKDGRQGVRFINLSRLHQEDIHAFVAQPELLPR